MGTDDETLIRIVVARRSVCYLLEYVPTRSDFSVNSIITLLLYFSVLIAYSEIDMVEIKAAFFDKFNKSLAKMIKASAFYIPDCIFITNMN